MATSASLVAKAKEASKAVAYDGSNPERVDEKTRTLHDIISMLKDEDKAVALLTDNTMPHVMNLFSANLFRALRGPKPDFDPDQDLPQKDPAWVHLELIYELLTIVIQAPIPPRVAKRYITPTLCTQWIGLLRSQDQEERLAVATILHKLYAKFKSLRATFRQTVGYTFLQFVEEPSLYPFGIGELLEVYASIIKGFATPLLPDHTTFMIKNMLPLLKPAPLPTYHQPLLLCLTMYLEKDQTTMHAMLSHLIKFWPWQATSKQILFINTVEEILELTPIEEITKAEKRQLVGVLGKCLESQHFQVAERTLFLWNNPFLINHSILNQEHARDLLPILFPPLFKAFKFHWNITVRGLARSVLEMYTKYDFAGYRRCLETFETDQIALIVAQDQKEAKWQQLYDQIPS